MSRRQFAERHAADAYALQARHLQADELAHAPDLTLFPLAQYEAQLISALLGDMSRFEGDAIQAQTVIEQFKPLVIELAFHAYVILFFDSRVFADQQFGDAPILGKNQKSRRVDEAALNPERTSTFASKGFLAGAAAQPAKGEKPAKPEKPGKKKGKK